MLTRLSNLASALRATHAPSANERSDSPQALPKRRLAMIVSHPIQYYVPLYRLLAQRQDVELKVFFTWHAGTAAVEDHGFRSSIAWDIPLTQSYSFELVPNRSSDPGTHHFFGLNNPSLVSRVMSWRPDVVHITGWAWLSHLLALRSLRQRGIRVLFRGDLHLLGKARRGPHWWFKRAVLRQVFSWPTGFLVTGTANEAYYRAFGVKPVALFPCPHSIDVAHFARPAQQFEEEAARWRAQLAIASAQRVLLFAGKFERVKRPLELMRAVQLLSDRDVVLIMTGGGELAHEVNTLAASEPARFRVLPFQNQSRMPAVYRLCDLFILPSASETWGLAVNEALACGRPVLVSDRVGCARDVVDASCGRVFALAEPEGLVRALDALLYDRNTLRLMRRGALSRAWSFDVTQTESALVAALSRVSDYENFLRLDPAS